LLQESTEEETSTKKVTPAELEEILKRLTHHEPRQQVAEAEDNRKKVSAEEMESILTRLMTFDAKRWPPESKPEVYKLHSKRD